MLGERIESGGNLDTKGLAIRAEEERGERAREDENGSVGLGEEDRSRRGEVISYESPEMIRAKDLWLAIHELEKNK